MQTEWLPQNSNKLKILVISFKRKCAVKKSYAANPIQKMQKKVTFVFLNRSGSLYPNLYSSHAVLEAEPERVEKAKETKDHKFVCITCKRSTASSTCCNNSRTSRRQSSYSSVFQNVSNARIKQFNKGIFEGFEEYNNGRSQLFRRLNCWASFSQAGKEQSSLRF